MKVQPRLASFELQYEKEFHHQQSRGNRGAMLPLSETNGIALDLEVSRIQRLVFVPARILNLTMQ